MTSIHASILPSFLPSFLRIDSKDSQNRHHKPGLRREDIRRGTQNPRRGKDEKGNQGNPRFIGIEETSPFGFSFSPTLVDVVQTHGHRHREGRAVKEDLTQVREIKGGEGRNAREEKRSAEHGREDVNEGEADLGSVVAPWQEEDARIVSGR